MPEVIVELRGKTETWKLDRTRTVIGRSRAADIRIHHPSISGRHARIEWADGILRLVDAGSRHGIFLNGSKVDEVVLTDGLAVTIGKARLTFKTGGGQARAECLQWLQLPNPGRSGISP
ncbi:MAG: FHA domain-containing protein, partial [Planctomycetes bacterium]|nr:FHA domain-containing protein [Planctomycetota bacterium]